MAKNIIQKSWDLLLKRQTNILSAAFVIMGTVVFSQVLGLIRQRLLFAIFGPSDIVGVYQAATKFPDLLFQLIIAGALASAFIPVYTDFLVKDKKEEAYKMASTLLTIGIVIFFIFSCFLFLFTPFFLSLLNVGAGFTVEQMNLMVDLTRIIIFAQLLFIIATFFSVLLQCYNHFFIAGFAAALYNLGIIIGIFFLHPFFGIASAAYGNVIGAILFILFQIPIVLGLGFKYKPLFSFETPGVLETIKLMWPRTISIAIFQVGTLLTVSLISFLVSAGRNLVLLDSAQTLAYAPIVLFGQTIAQAAFPVLSREREKLEDFKATFITSFNQMLYLVLPISALLIVLRIPSVRIVFGAKSFDWDATVITASTLSLFAIGIFAQALTYLVSRGFYALHDTKTPLIIGGITTGLMIFLGWIFIVLFHFGIGSIAMAYSLAGIVNVFLLMYFLNKKVGGFNKKDLFQTNFKILSATFFTGFALYIPIKLLDKTVVDTTYTINLIFLMGISAGAGLLLYLFLTWLFNVKEATTFILIFKKLGNWREILGLSEESIDPTRMNP